MLLESYIYLYIYGRVGADIGVKEGRLLEVKPWIGGPHLVYAFTSFLLNTPKFHKVRPSQVATQMCS